MNPPSFQFKLGARDAWMILSRGTSVETMLALTEEPEDDYQKGWRAQCRDSDTELFPRFEEPRDLSLLKGGVIGVAITGLAVLALWCGFHGIRWPHIVAGIVLAGVFAAVMRIKTAEV